MNPVAIAKRATGAPHIRRALPSLIAVPLLLALLDVSANAWRSLAAAEYIMLPPFAVIIFLLFTQATGVSANLRSIVVLPCVGAAVGALCWHFLGSGAVSVALATWVVLVVQMILRAYMPPALALAVLAPLLRVDVGLYVGGVAIGTGIIGLAFVFWRNALCKWFAVDFELGMIRN